MSMMMDRTQAVKLALTTALARREDYVLQKDRDAFACLLEQTTIERDEVRIPFRLSNYGDQVTMTISIRSTSYRAAEDEATGDWCLYYNIQPQVSWSSYDGPPERAQEIMSLMLTATNAADEVARVLRDTQVREIVETKQQHAENEARRAKEAINRNVRAACKEIRKGMRVGTERSLPRALFGETPDGSYSFTYLDGNQDRRYTVTIRSSSSYIVRNA